MLGRLSADAKYEQLRSGIWAVRFTVVVDDVGYDPGRDASTIVTSFIAVRGRQDTFDDEADTLFVGDEVAVLGRIGQYVGDDNRRHTLVAADEFRLIHRGRARREEEAR